MPKWSARTSSFRARCEFGPAWRSERLSLELRRSYFKRFAQRLALPGKLAVLGQPHLREDAADILRDQIVNGLRLMIKRRDRRHDHRSGLLRAHHVFEMDAIERRITNAEHQPTAFFERHIGGTRNEIVACSTGNRGERAHRARYD